MTIKELYEWAVKNGKENSKLIITYFPDDDYYAFDDKEIEEKVLEIKDDTVFVNLEDDYYNTDDK